VEQNGIASRPSAGLGEKLVRAEDVAGDPIPLVWMVREIGGITSRAEES